MPAFSGSMVVACVLWLTSATVVEARSQHAREGEPSWLHLAAGMSGVFDEDRNAQVLLSYRFAGGFAGLHPYTILGAAAGGDVYGGAGVLYNLDCTPGLRITAGSGPGFYARSARGVDLGHHVEFLSMIEFSYAFHRSSRVGLALSHLSNGRLKRINPGMELLQLTYSIRSW